MNVEYKGYCIITGSDYDDASKCWNGRYRIMDDNDIVVYESFVEPSRDADEAQAAADREARAWVDKEGKVGKGTGQPGAAG